MGMYQRRLGKYELQERVGRGASEVWKAFDSQQRRFVAIKILPVNAQTSADFAPRFYREAQTLVALRHPNIVPVLDFYMSENGNEAYLIMDYVEGLSLADYLDSTSHQGKIPSPDEIVRLLTPIAIALDYAHQRKVIHGALKPAAIVLDKANTTSLAAGEPKLVDFGENQTLSPLSLPLSDAPYISPEVAQGYAATSRSDLYSLGVILYELCTGALPFHSDTASDMLMQHIHGAPTAPALINPHIRPALSAVIMRSIARDQASRYPTAAAMVAAVAKALNVSVPESIRHAESLPGIVNSPSQSGIGDSLDTVNSPTYLSPLPQYSSPGTSPVPPVLTGNTTPILPPASFTPSSTPVLPVTPTGAIPEMQTPSQAEMDLPTVLASHPQAATAVSGSVPPTTIPGSSSVRAVPSSSFAKRPRRNWLYIVLIVALLLVLLISAFSAYFYYYSRNPSPPTSQIVGQAFFVSSGLLNQNSNQGITDVLQINLDNLSDPQPGKRYYAWLLNDHQNNVPAIFLGALTVDHGRATRTYNDPAHNNLLANYSRFLITEEDANQQPLNPSLDTSTWRYAAFFSATPNPNDIENHFSLLDHLRHLLSQDPKLQKAGLTGGLDIWLFRNTTKILEAAGSGRDAQKRCTPDPNNADCAFVHRAVVRVLDYLDGSTYVQTEVPPGTLLYIDPVIARVALLTIDPVNQQPPGYLNHIGNHLREITESPGVTPAQRALAIRVNGAINNVQGWLGAVHADAVKLVQMNNAQLSQPDALSILNDILKQANFAFVGQFDPNTSTVREGVVQIHYNIQGLATFEVTPCTMTNGKSSCAI